MLANSDFFTGAFPAEYGNATAAVFDMKFRNGNPDRHEHTFQAGVLGIDVSSEGPLSKRTGSSYLFNYRYSTMGLLHDLYLLPSDQQFRYQDLSFKLNFPTRKAGTQNYLPETYRTLVDEEGETVAGEVFAQLQYAFSSRVTLNAGLRSNYFGVNGEFTLEPRLGLRWVPHSDHAINLGYGLHSRAEELRFYLLEVDGEHPNNNLPLSKSHHGVIGYDWRINPRARFKAEAYYQHLFDIPGEEGSTYSLINFKQDFTFNKVLINNTRGYNYGLDLTLERFMHGNYYYLLTASLYESKYKGGDGMWHNTRFNGNWVGNALFGKEFFFKENTRVLDFNVRLSVVGGERYTPALEMESKQLRRVVYDDSRASSLFSIHIKNLVGTPVYEGIDYNLLTDRVEITKSTYILPLLSYKIEF